MTYVAIQHRARISRTGADGRELDTCECCDVARTGRAATNWPLDANVCPRCSTIARRLAVLDDVTLCPDLDAAAPTCGGVDGPPSATT